jgi:hypothetical protein
MQPGVQVLDFIPLYYLLVSAAIVGAIRLTCYIPRYGESTAKSVQIDTGRRLAYVSTSTGVQVVSLEENRSWIGNCAGSNSALAADVSAGGDTIFVACGADGILVLHAVPFAQSYPLP